MLRETAHLASTLAHKVIQLGNEPTSFDTVEKFHSGARPAMENFTDVLLALGKGAHRMRKIVIAANLSLTRVTQILGKLEQAGLVTILPIDQERFYSLSEKGFDLLNRMLEVETGLGLHIENFQENGSSDQ